ncbi:MAG: V-type ATPase subunit [Oscillospiraceae bacterium]|nr:V-type ATPase subunit [Oscillospiraceae bacterium]
MQKNYNATVAKIMAIYGKRLKPQDYTEMMNRQSVSDVAEYLKKNTYYGKLLASIDTNTIHRGMLENLLRRSVFETYMRITGFEHISNQRFYNYKIIQTEIDEIVRCIRCINAGSDKLIQDVPVYINHLTSFDLLELAKINDFSGLLEFIRKTPYYDILKDISPNEDGKVDVTKCETLLRTYYINMFRNSADFRSSDSKQFISFLETEIDLINIINSYRLTAYFDASEDDIERDMLTFHGRLTAERHREIYSAPNEEEFIRRFAKTYYGKQMIQNGYDITNIEQSARRLRHKYARSLLRRSGAAPLSVYAFIFLRETEVQNIISIIEGIRYGVESSKIASLIIT